MNVLGLFDGISCGQLALKKIGKKYRYFSSEIDDSAIKVAQDNFPETTQLGDIRDVTYKDGYIKNNIKSFEVGSIDLVLGGSPCTNLSFSGKREGMITKENIEITSYEKYVDLKSSNFDFSGQSYLFWEYVRLIKEINPKYFLLENVPMEKKWIEVISSSLGVSPREINSSLVSAQNRKRLYWTNIPNINNPKDKKINLSDILDSRSNYEYSKAAFDTLEKNKFIFKEGAVCYSTSGRGGGVVEFRLSNNDKAHTLTGVGYTNRSFSGFVVKKEEKFLVRKLSLSECKKLQTVPQSFKMNVSDSKAKKLLGNGWTVDIIAHLLSGI